MKYSDELLDKYRYIIVDNTYWDYDIKAQFTKDMEAIGICVYHIFYTGFCSQGDGASFNGRVTNLDAFMKAMGASWSDYPNTKAVLDQTDNEIFISWAHVNGYYTHEKTLTFYIEYDRMADNLSWSDPELLHEAAQAIDKAADGEHLTLEKDIKSFVEGLCQDLYKKLRDEYFYLTSDESVAEIIERNGLAEECA